MKQKSIVAHNLKKIREIRGYTQAGLAELAGVSTIAISHIETGHRWPRKETLKQIAKILDVEIDDLLSSENVKPKVAVENPTLADAVLILDKLLETKPLYRSVILAMLFRDDSLVLPGAPAGILAGLHTVQKAL